MTLKISRLIEMFYPAISGPANQAYQISSKLERNNIKSPIFTTNYNAVDEPVRDKIDNVNIFRFKSRFEFMRYIYTPGMYESIKRQNPDIVHAHNFRSYQVETANKLSKKLNIPFIINTHGALLGYEQITEGVKQLPYKLYDAFRGRNIIDDADAIVVSSKTEYEEAIKYGVDENKLHIIPMGIDVSEYDEFKKTNKNDRKLNLLFVGRICRDRNIMPILEALTILKEKNKKYNDKIEFRIVGHSIKRSNTEKDGYLEELKEYVGVNELNVKFLGPIYDDDLKQEYKNADIFVYTSVWENFGQTLLEAGASSLPIICSDVGISKEIISNGKSGFIVGADNSKMISKRILELAKDAKKRVMFGKLVREKIENLYGWDGIMMKYEELYVGLMKGKED